MSVRKRLLPLLACVAAGALLACTATVQSSATSTDPASARAVLAVAVSPPSGVVMASQPQAIPTVSRHSAFPGLAQAPDGRLVLVWRGGTDHAQARDGSIYRSTSTDQGRTWGPAVKVLAGRDYRDPSVSFIGGHEYLTFFTGTNAEPAQGAYVVRDPLAGGQPVRVDGGLPYAAISSPVVQLPNGQLGTSFYGKKPGESTVTAWMAWSSDLGSSWTVNRIINSGIDTAEPVLVVDGSLVHMFARWGSTAIAVRSSSNSGATWGDVRVGVTDCSGRPSTTVAQAGTIVMMCRGPLSSGPHAKIVFSLDHAASFRVGPTVMVAPVGSFGMTYGAYAPVQPFGTVAVFGMEQPDGSSNLYSVYLAESR